MLNCSRSTALLLRLVCGVLAALGCVRVAHGQAVVEYALKTSGSAVATSGAGPAIGGCRVDSTLLTCLGESYPKATLVVIGLLTVMIVRRLVRAHRAPL